MRYYTTMFAAKPGSPHESATNSMPVDCPDDASLLDAIKAFAMNPEVERLVDVPKGMTLQAITFSVIPMPGSEA